MHEREFYEGPDGSAAIVSHLRLRNEWAASVRDSHGTYETVGVYPTREAARDALRARCEWPLHPADAGKLV